MCYLTFAFFVVDTEKIVGIKSPVKMICSVTSEEDVKSGNGDDSGLGLLGR
jgi:hypothetical protein